MKKLVLFSVGILAFALVNAHAQNIIADATYDDWTNWNGTGGSGGWFGYTVQGVNTFNYGGITVNGINNPTAPGVTTDGAGALQASPITNGWGVAFTGNGPTTAVLTALDGPTAASGTLVAQSGTIYVYYTQPDHSISGSNFQLGIFANYSGGWGPWNPSTVIDLGPVSTPSGTQEMMEAVIPYTISPCTLGYFQWGLFQNTDYQGTNNWYVASIQIAPLPTSIIPPPVYPLFTTYDDFTPFTASSGDLVQPDNTWDTDGDTTNGLGNLTAPGAIGTAGSLLVYWSSLETSWGTVAIGPNEAANAAFMQVIDPGCNTNSQTTVAAYGNIYVDFSQPDNSGGGNYFQLGVNLSYPANGYYQNFFSSGATDLHLKDDSGYEVYRATIPYTINAGSYAGDFTPGIAVNSNYQPTNGFHVDNITVSAAQAPLITGISLNGSQLVIQGTNGLTGYTFNLLSSTNLLLPLSQWTIVSPGNAFNGPTFSITNTINPASPQMFYIIQTEP
jgi:hypothetical protein